MIKKAANLDLEFEREEGGIDMCQSLERRYKKEKIEGVIQGMQLMGASEDDIIMKIVENFSVSKEYVLSLLAPKIA